MSGYTGEQLASIDGANALWDAQEAIRNGVWPAEHLGALMAPLMEFAGQKEIGFHHIGYTYPNRDEFEVAVTHAGQLGEVVASDLQTPVDLHHRRYLRVPRNDGPDTFIEHHLVGDEGDGTRGVHLDFTVEDAATMLDRVKASLMPVELDAKIVTKGFGGGNAPIGKVALQPLSIPGALETGIMFRTFYSDPVDW